MTSLKEQAVSGVKWSGSSNLAIALIQFLQLVTLARLLTPEDFGLMAMILVVVGFAQAYGDMGISNAIIYKREISRNQLSSLYWLNMVAGTVVFMLVVASIPLIVSFYEEPRLTSLLFLSSFIFIITPLGQQFQILLQKNLRFNILTTIEVTSTLAGVIVAVLTALRGMGVYSLVFGQLVNTSTKSFLLAITCWDDWKPQAHFSMRDAREFVGFGLYQMGERGINYLSSNIDKLLIGKLLGSATLGLYAVANQLMIKPMLIINPAVTRVAFPIFARLQNDNSKLNRAYIQVSQMISLVTIPLYFAMFAMARPLLLVLLGADWTSATRILEILTFVGIIYSLANPVGCILLAKGRPDLGFWINAFALALYTVAIIYASRWGISGIALSMVLISAVVIFPLEITMVLRLTGLPLRAYIKTIVPIVLISMLMSIILRILSNYLYVEMVLLQLILLIVIGIAVYAISLMMWNKKYMKETAALVFGQRIQ